MRRMPHFTARGEGEEAGDHQQQDAPKQVMNVEAASGDQIAEATVRKQIEMDDRGDRAENGEGDEVRREGAERNPLSRRR